MFSKMPRKPDFPAQEKEIMSFWDENGIVQKSMDRNKGKERFVFYEGPPTANGMPHVGHVLTRVIKDVILRYRSMCGMDVLRKAGWDTHGLPVEIQVEKELGLKDKGEIEQYGVAEFVKKCRESVFKYEGEWRKMTARVGFWCDMDEPYITCTNNYIESVWWVLKSFWKKGLLYKGHKIVPHCPRCDTALSSHEVAQGYKEVDDPSVFIKCPVKDMENTSFLVWTTTPWTLISNVALAMAEHIEYVKVEADGEYLILAEGRLEAVFGDNKPGVIERFRGGELAGLQYEPPFRFCDTGDKDAFYVILADFVSLEEGTGIVHLAPAFGEDDYRIGVDYDLPFLQPVDLAGRFTDVVTPWKGRFIKEADPDIIEDLKQRNVLFMADVYTHSYPFCWRCKSPLIYYGRSSWFINTTSYKNTLLDVNDEINWIPDHIRKGRMGDFLENNIDWAVSRDRYWGTPLNLWICEKDSDHMLSVDSAAELKEHAVDFPEGELDLHKPWIDEIHCECPECGGRMSRTPEVIDCWLDSGAMPYAQWHYPHENKELFESVFPADFITEAVDQTRGWFYSLMALGSFLFERSPFKNCIVMGHVLDGEGRKMSKSLGNVIEPQDAFEKFGADAFRWLFYRENNPWIPTRFSDDYLMEIIKNYFLNLWNTYSFFTIYAEIDGFDPDKHKVPREDLQMIDRWVLSRVNNCLKEIRGCLNDYDITPAARIMEVLLEDISNWYVRRCRQRFWKPGKDTDKWAAYTTLHQVLVDYAKMLAPFCPFISEYLFRTLAGPVGAEPESVHLADYPELDYTLMNRDLEEEMEIVRQIVNEGRSLRSRRALKVRQPLPMLFIKRPKASVKSRATALPFIELIKEELNVEDVTRLENFKSLEDVTLKPNYKTLGPKLGKTIRDVDTFFKELEDHEELADRHARGKPVEIEINGETISFGKDDLVVERTPKDYIVMGEITALDTRLNDELIASGRARDIVHAIQNIRKEMDLDYDARITICYCGDDDVKKVFGGFADYIMHETLATGIDSVETLESGEEVKLGEGLTCRVAVSANS